MSVKSKKKLPNYQDDHKVNPKRPTAHSFDNSSSASQNQLEAIKSMLAKGATQLEISRVLGIDNSVLSCKIQAWVRTDDFRNWVRFAWVVKYAELVKEDPRTAFKNITRLFAIMLSKETGSDEVKRATEIVIKAWQPPKK